jgi:ferredoxin-NADP reductase
LSTPARNAHLDLTIRAPNGSPWVTDHFKAKDTVEEVVDKAVDHFVKKHIMQAGEYDLVLVVAGVSRPPLHPSDTLADASVTDDAILSLVPREKQVDG